MRAWHRFVRDKIKLLSECSMVYDIGGGAAPADKKSFRKYVLVDVDQSYKPDIIADIQKLPFDSNSIPGIICLSVLEHVENPFLATDEMYRVLRPGGLALVSVPFIWPYHANEHYKDYWRFSEDALRLLFKKFSKIEIIKEGGYFSVWVNLIPSYLKLYKFLKPAAAYIDDKWSLGRRNFPAYFIFLIK